MSNKEDLRIIKTRAAIKEAFFQLLAEKPFEKITVSDITGKALIHRGTFYSHYTDKYDLMEQIENEVIDSIGNFVTLVNRETLEKSFTEHEPLPHIVPLLSYIEEHPEFFRLIIGSSSPFFDKVTDRYFDYAIKMLQLPEDEWLAYRKDILRATITSILSRWVSQGMKESKEDLAVWITEILISNWAPISSRP